MKKEIIFYKNNFEKEKIKLFPINPVSKYSSHFITTYQNDYKPPLLNKSIKKENQMIICNRLSKNNKLFPI